MRLTWKRTLAVWWSLFWRGTLLGILFGALIGGVLGGILGAGGYPPELIQSYGSLAGYAGGLVASIVAVKLALQKHLPTLAVSAKIGAGEPEADFASRA